MVAIDPNSPVDAETGEPNVGVVVVVVVDPKLESGVGPDPNSPVDGAGGLNVEVCTAGVVPNPADVDGADPNPPKPESVVVVLVDPNTPVVVLPPPNIPPPLAEVGTADPNKPPVVGVGAPKGNVVVLVAGAPNAGAGEANPPNPEVV